MTSNSKLSYVPRGFYFPLALVLLILVIAVSEIGFQRSMGAKREIALSQEKISQLHLLFQQMLDAETGQRGYLLTGQKSYLEPYTVAMADIGKTLDSLRTSYLHSAELENFAKLSRAVSRKMGELEITVKVRAKSSDSSDWLAIVETDMGKEHMDLIRSAIAELRLSADLDTKSAMTRVSDSLELSRAGILVLAVLGLLAFYLYLRQTKRFEVVEIERRNSLANEAQRLSTLVSERTASLTELAVHLTTVQERERDRLARELHDELGALLTLAKLDIARVKSFLPPESDHAIARLAHLNTTINSVVALKRRVIEDLRPSSLSNLGLSAALDILAREFRERSGIDINVDIEAVKLSHEAELTVFRMVQESLTNAAKYAQASEITVTLHDYDHHIEVSIADNGLGFDVSAKKRGSYGLTGMQHRVQALGGTFTVTSQSGAGTKIDAVIPKAPSISA